MARQWRNRLGAPLLLGGLATAPAALAQTIYVPAPMPVFVPAPDFTAVKTRPLAERLTGERWLVKSWFFPTELGGQEDPENIAYITPAAARARAALIEKLKRLMERDLVDRLDVEADYKGDSIVPSRIRYIATHSRGGARVEEEVEVW
ncbi:hypothetical protein HZY97_12290 [Sphingomonas sp. R-74633]|uniref:hypothetical protein n=1 Tax=Sphingomonas sp. R-74633 TaxID=2751188 RepID=UPI0015D34DF8|nr:hypothetical protein [Sphingomonas sp. R-74633]NYT41542.1 hypothetical protein [Sphingomonas sp. R-74633]